tara:strand:+ start:3739 stop:4569 length:831 start_codon:yes stop_codon:yes gene_type:complete
MVVPKIIHQIWIGDKPAPETCMETIKKDNINFEYMRWSQKELNKLDISKTLDLKIKCMKEYCGKADIWRYVILKKYGGIFIDADSISIEPLDDFLFNKAFMAFENEMVRPNLVANGIMAFPPNHGFISMLLNHIESNPIQSPAWQNTGPLLVTKMLRQYPLKDIQLFPSYLFYPDHHQQVKYQGHGKVYMYQLWGSTNNNYNSISKETNIHLPKHLHTPNEVINISIPENISKKQLKDIMNSLKQMDGHYNIVIDTKHDISKYLNSTRFIQLSSFP